ncbi:MAG: hypothetical protein RMK81_02570 [Geminicoccaceae bacterium]|nr:hypothetical protein [Geminicoccaceae bacterium]MDW8369125.1 hypothetical protein [Geminicoccaceae bacterium]
MKPFLAALLAAVAIAWAAQWLLIHPFAWTSADRFAADDSVRLDAAAAVRPGF